jgi:hypothetical protein
MKYRKKPIVIDAMQLTDTSIRACYEWVHGKIQPLTSWQAADRWLGYEGIVKRDGLEIPTLEDGADGRAKHVASIGDWIIKGIKDEFYACKPDIFEMTYEPIED